MTKQLLLILTVVVWTLPSWAVKTPGEGWSGQEVANFGIEADPEAVLAFVRQDHPHCGPSCRRLALRYFHHNPQVTAEQFAEGLELWATLGQMDNLAFLDLTPAAFAEAPSFHDFPRRERTCASVFH